MCAIPIQSRSGSAAPAGRPKAAEDGTVRRATTTSSPPPRLAAAAALAVRGVLTPCRRTSPGQRACALPVPRPWRS